MSDTPAQAPVIQPKGRTGDWIATITGKRWFLTDPHPDDVDIEDIAHGLSMICRFGGHCREFYSVAQHSVHVADEVARLGFPEEMVLWGLLHDAAEAYLGDMVRPLKQNMPAYQRVEHLTEGCILTGLGLDVPTHGTRSTVKRFDDVLLMTERRDLMNHCGHDWTPRAEPLGFAIKPWAPEFAKQRFLELYQQLRMAIRGGASV